MSLIADQPVSIGKILDTSFRLYTASFKKVIGYGLIIGSVYLILTVAMNLLLLSEGEDPGQINATVMQSMLSVMGLTILAGIVATIFYVAIIYRIDNLVCNRDDSFSEGLMKGIKKFPATFLGMFLYVIALGIGTVFLVVPGVIFSLSLLFYLYYIVVEDHSTISALKASHKIVWGDWWRTLMVFMVPGFLLLIVYMLIGMLAVYMGEFDTANTAPLSVVDVFTNLTSAFIAPYFYALGYVQYRDLKLRKTGDDLEARIAQQIAQSS